MDTLMTVIVTWLSMNFALPAIHDHPRIERVPASTMAAMRYGLPVAGRPDAAVDASRESGRAVQPEHARSVVALYHDKTRTIYLPEGWTGRTPEELSVLVHEMVHHLQNAGGLKHECPQAREKLAYAAQDRWLAMFGRNLADEFELDPMNLLVLTNCMG